MKMRSLSWESGEVRAADGAPGVLLPPAPRWPPRARARPEGGERDSDMRAPPWAGTQGRARGRAAFFFFLVVNSEVPVTGGEEKTRV